MNKMKTFSLILAIVLSGLILIPELAAQSLSVKPGLVRMENEKLAIGVDVEADYQKEYTLTSETTFPRLIQFDLAANATLLRRPAMNPKHQNLDLFLGYLVSFKKAQELQPGEEPEPGTDYGSLGLGINASFEADQTFTEQNVESGIELRYVNSAHQFLPILESSYQFVLPVRSDIRDDLNEDNDFFKRFEARAFWAVRLNRFLLNPDFRYFRSIDLSSDLENLGLDEGLHSSISLGYMFANEETGPLRFFEYIYLQYNHGQLPVYLDNRETIEAGITFGFWR